MTYSRTLSHRRGVSAPAAAVIAVALAASTLVGTGLVGTGLVGTGPASAATPEQAPQISAVGPAPGAPGEQATWTTGAKQGVGTSTTTESPVWYTLSEGTLAEVYYPRVDVANSRSLELIVTDGKTFADLESTHTEHEIELVDPKALVYRQINTDLDGRYEISKTYYTDPERATILVDITLRSLDGGRYTVYAQYDPSLANSGLHDSARTEKGALVAEDSGAEGAPTQPIASALIADRTFSATSSGYFGVSDGWSDLADDFVLGDTYASAPDGNVVQTARLKLRGSARELRGTLALAFGASTREAVSVARASLRGGAEREYRAYVRGWHRYIGDLDSLPRSVRRDDQLATQYTVAAMTLKAHEDKTYRGANIASLTVPWGEAQNANETGVGGYHLVWARDLYQVATAQLAIGDADAAGRSLDYLFEVQQRPDGSFPQNTLLDGTPYWGSLQLDEVALPIVLAWQLGRDDADTYADHVKKAADFIVSHGPATPQERWEEEGGYSPSTIAAEIAGLIAAADIARANNDDASAAIYTGVADDWQRRVESWTYTRTGPINGEGDSDGNYYLRVDGNGDPNDGATLSINNGGGDWDERAIVDAGFLELVRLGVKPADDPAVASSLAEVDATIKVESPDGDLWYRYNHDGYGEKANGAPFDGTGVGRLWPLLSGERGEYELAAGRDAGSYLRTMAETANAGFLIPEQVWDNPQPTRFDFEFGEGTGAATPLAWSMAQFLRLAVSIDEEAPVETPAVVAERYADGSLPAGPALEVSIPENGTTTDQAAIELAGTSAASTVYVSVGGDVTTTDVRAGTFTTTVPLALGPNTVTIVALGEDGSTTLVQRAVTSVNFGTPVGSIADPVGDDNGPGSYVYPTNSAFGEGAFDLTRFAVYEAGGGGDDGTVTLVGTLAGAIENPWGGNQLSVQRLDIYVTADGGSGGPVDARLGTNAQLENPYDLVVTGSGFAVPAARDANGDVTANVTMLVLPETGQIALSVPRTAFGDVDPATAGYQVTVTSHADENEGRGGIRPVYSQTNAEFRFGGGAGEYTDSNPARDTDSSDPNVLDILTPTGDEQATILDWAQSAPVVLPYVALD
ncbi:MAG: glucoamylase [Microbacteriaceae bacterium]|nr:glucoamylase [Microbacteriaceae bacterium]